MKRLLAVCATAAVGAALVATGPTGSAGATARSTAPARQGVGVPTPTAPTWTDCTDPSLQGLQCGRIQVPLDYTDPTGAKITLALTRQVHTGSDYKGILVGNPGGPGGSGTWIPYLSDYVPNGVGSDYDWIGFDPRGVGASTPSLHCSTVYNLNDRPPYSPTVASIHDYWLPKAKYYADHCATSSAKALLPHLTTVESAEDLESIRLALGADKLNYYGFSYGTYLGQVYAQLFPATVGRFVLDGVVDASRAWYAANLDQDVAFDKNIDVFFQWIAAHPRSFHLGTNWRTISAGYYHELTVLQAHPSAAGKLGPDELTDALTSAAYYVYDWVGTANGYSQLIRHNRGGAMYVRSGAGRGDDNEFAVYNGVQCTDAVWPNWSKTGTDARSIDKAHPFLTWSNTWYNAPCLYWHAKQGDHVSVTGTTAPMLLMSETRDAATPYSGAIATRKLFTGSRLLAGVGGTTHASSLSGVACVDVRIANYLDTGALPARKAGNVSDVQCPRLAPPVPPKTAARGTAGAHGMPLWLRHKLIAAQHP